MGQYQFENSPSIDSKSVKSSGCSPALAMGGLGLWAILVTLVAQIAMAFAEQDLMMKVHAPPDLRWLIVAAEGALLALPAWTTWYFTRGSRAAAAARIYGLAGLFVVLQAPARLAKIQDSQLGLLIQLSGILLFALLLGLSEARAGRRLSVPALDGLAGRWLWARCWGCPGPCCAPWGRLWIHCWHCWLG